MRPTRPGPEDEARRGQGHPKATQDPSPVSKLLLVHFVHRSTLVYYRSLGEGCPNGKFSEERCVCVYARVACVMERRRMLAGQIRGSECTAPAPAAARILDWVLSRFCLGFVSPHLPQTPYHPTGGVISMESIFPIGKRICHYSTSVADLCVCV